MVASVFGGVGVGDVTGYVVAVVNFVVVGVDDGGVDDVVGCGSVVVNVAVDVAVVGVCCCVYR